MEFNYSNPICGYFKPGDWYEIWKYVGAGGGHTIAINNFSLTFEFANSDDFKA